MLVANQLKRKFSFQNDRQEILLSDPDCKLSPQAVLDFYSQNYPVLVTAKIEGPLLRDDVVQYQFVSTIGTKG